MISRRAVLGAGIVGWMAEVLQVRAQENQDIRWDQTFDVVVAGAGGAGLAVAARAAQLNNSVCVFEKMPKIGGNTALASGYVSAPWPKYQAPNDVIDSVDKFQQAVLSNAGPSADLRRVRRFSQEVTPTLEWLESLGLRFAPQAMIVSGDHFPRAYRPEQGGGVSFVRTLSTTAMKLNARIVCNSPVKKLIWDDDLQRIVGVAIRHDRSVQYVLARKAVVIASGGFCADDAMVARFAPRYKNLTHNNSKGCTGELIVEAQRMGAQLIDMDKIQCQPGAPIGRSYRVRLHNEPNRFVLIDRNGQRFIREDERRDRLRDAVLGLPGQYAFALVDNDGFNAYSRTIQKETVWGVETGDAFVAYSIDELAKKLQIDYAQLAKTIQEYNDAVSIQYDRLGKDMTFCQRIEKPPFWVALAGMTRHASQGGIRVDEFGRVLNRDAQAIAGLWAAGETTGGLHGENQMGGNGLSEAFTFGRLVAEKICET